MAGGKMASKSWASTSASDSVFSSQASFTELSTANLVDFLWESPFLFDYTFDDTAKRQILKKCYQSLWKNNQEYMQRYFFANNERFQQSIEYQLHRREAKADYPGMTGSAVLQSAIDPSKQHENTFNILPCTRGFRKGEPIYRCRTCGLDDTCVLCSDCFHATFHENHDVIVSISPGSSGCCDCTDREAWKVPLHCNIHGEPDLSMDAQILSKDVPDQLVENIRQCVSSVLDFILQVFALAPEEVVLPKDNADIRKWSRDERKVFRHLAIPTSATSLPSVFIKRRKRTRQQEVGQGQSPHRWQAGSSIEEDVDMDKENQDHMHEDPSNMPNEGPSSYLDDKEEDELYACVVWNDEAHAFTHILDSLMLATQCTWDEAKKFVDTIHFQGRDIIAVSTDLDELRRIATPLMSINLGISIRPARDIFREQVCTVLVDWLRDLVNGQMQFFSGVDSGHCFFRTLLCEELSRVWDLPLPLARLTSGTSSERPMSEDKDFELRQEAPALFQMREVGEENTAAPAMFPMREDGGGEDTEMLERDHAGTHGHHRPSGHTESPESTSGAHPNQCDIATVDWDPVPMLQDYQALQKEEDGFGIELVKAGGLVKDAQPVIARPSDEDAKAIPITLKNEFQEKLRLDYFILYDLKLWKEIRISLRELYIGAISNPRFKRLLGTRLVRNYARTAESFLLKDREPENSIILFSVQLLTVPSVSMFLVTDYFFFGLICSTLSAFFLTDHIYFLTPSDKNDRLTRVNCESRAFRTRRYFNAFHDLRYILNVDSLKPLLVQDPLYLRQFMDLISLFQGMNPQVCQKDTHVEYESEVWVNAFHVTLQIAKCCRCFAECFVKLPRETHEDRIASARTLVRAVSRVLRAIDEWGSEPEVNDTPEQEQKHPIIAPTAMHKYHTVSMPYFENVQVIKYDIASEPVSFHQPLHWLLAGILESVSWLDDQVLHDAGWPSGFTSAITLFKTITTHTRPSHAEILLPILEGPIRTLAFSSQIRAGVWVRNGYNIRNQIHHYRDISLRENTYDADVFLLQLAFATIDPDLVIITLMDRYGLVNWFKGIVEHELYDNLQTVFMVEELLCLLIICASERSNATGMTLQERMQREIIHSLCLGPIVYSEFAKRIPERLTEHPDFDKVLNKTTTFKAPESINDSGSYELRSEYFDDIDPYFWHFSRNNREEAERVLKTRWKKSNPDRHQSDYLYLPKLTPIVSGPFTQLVNLLQSPVLVQMVSFALWNVKVHDSHKNNTIIDESLHLILLALSEVNDKNPASKRFHAYACEHRFQFTTADVKHQGMSLFNVLMIFRNDNEYKDTHQRIDWILDQLEMYGTPNVSATIREWKNEHNHGMEETAQVEESEYERKKREAKERQARIMAQFAQAQTQFMQLNEELYDENDEEDNEIDVEESFEEDAKDVRLYAYPTGTCIVCQEDVNEKSLPYGLLGLIQVSNIMRDLPTDDPTVFKDMMDTGPNLDSPWRDRQVGDNLPGSFPMNNHKSGLQATTCGHLMHVKCFSTYCSSIDTRHSAQLIRNHPENRIRKEFTCPLCKFLGNTILPVLWKGKVEKPLETMAVLDEDGFHQFLSAEIHVAANKIQSAIDPTRPVMLHRWSDDSQGSLLSTAPRLPSLRAMASSGMSDGSRRIPGLAALLGEEDSQALGPSSMLFKSALSASSEIKHNYMRLFELLTIILELCGIESTREMSLSIKNVDILWGLFGYTIATAEIASRGMPLPSGQSSDMAASGTLFDTLSSQSQLLLRMLGDTILAYTAVMCHPGQQQHQDSLSSSFLFQGHNNKKHNSEAINNVHSLALQRLQQIYMINSPELFDGTLACSPLLTDDPFMVLAELSLHLTEVTETDIHPHMRALFLAELAKAATGLLQGKYDIDSVLEPNDSMTPDADELASAWFGQLIMEKMQLPVNAQSEKLRQPYNFNRLLKTCALPFLRRTAILFVARYGLVCGTASKPAQYLEGKDEFDRLLATLRLPTLANLLQHPDTVQLVSGWCTQYLKDEERDKVDIPLSLPTPLYLVALPQRIDQLMDEGMRRVCDRCKMVPNDPAICLFCGTFVCAQSFCCADGEEGECNIHMMECGGEIGIYLMIKRCALIVLHNENGWFMNAPYLDKHGEVDHGLRRGRPQYLNAKRYADIRKLWLQHGIPAYIARQIEATFDVGGWTTL